MAAVSPSSQLKTELDSIATTVATGDTYAQFKDLPHALNAYRQAGIAFGKLPPVVGSAALVAQIAATTSATAAGLAQAKGLLDQLFALYEPASDGAAPADTSSSSGAGIFFIAALFTIAFGTAGALYRKRKKR